MAHITIESRGCQTEIFIDGKRLEGVRSVNYRHDLSIRPDPYLIIEMKATDLTIDTTQIPELPYPYSEFYTRRN